MYIINCSVNAFMYIYIYCIMNRGVRHNVNTLLGFTVNDRLSFESSNPGKNTVSRRKKSRRLLGIQKESG